MVTKKRRKTKKTATKAEVKTPQFNFDKVVKARLDRCQELLLIKGKEYVRGDDRFHNFTRGSEMNRETPTRSLHGMLTKHLTSYLDILDDIDKGNMPSEALVEEKFGDIIVYFLLQEAQIKKIIADKKA